MEKKFVIVGTGIAADVVMHHFAQDGIEAIVLRDVAELKEIEEAHQLPAIPVSPYLIEAIPVTDSEYPNNRTGRRKQARDNKRKLKTHFRG